MVLPSSRTGGGLDPLEKSWQHSTSPSRSVLPVLSRALVFAGRYRLHTWPHSLGVQDAVQVVDHVSYQTGNPAGAIHRLMGGVDYAFEVAGREQTVQQAWSSLDVGGEAVVVGLMPHRATVTLSAGGSVNEQVIRGCYFGA